MLFLNYVEEIKTRVMFSVLCFISAVFSCYFFSTEILIILTQPLKEIFYDKENVSLIFTNISDAFYTNLQIAFIFGFISSLPIFLINSFFYLIPGLYSYEKNNIIYLYILSTFCFIYINILCYYFLIPSLWNFFLNAQLVGSISLIEITYEGRVNEYITLIVYFLGFFNLIFQFPLIMYSFIKLSLINLEILQSLRKIIYFIFLIVAAGLSPPDVFSQLLIFTPIFIIYELSLLFLHILDKYKKE
jgi:sec-independent protein translocase protein TatC